MAGIILVALGVLFAGAAFLLLRRSVVKMIFGSVVRSQAVHLLILTASGLKTGAIPFVPQGETALAATAADPLPQALILTAIVISFGVLAFTLAMALRADQTMDTDDLDEMKNTDA